MPYRNLLLIDDDEDDLEIFMSAAKDISGTVSCIGMYNAAEALEKLLKKEIQPDVIFLDLNMPVMNGQQFLTEIKQIPELDGIPVIIFTTSSNQETIQLTKDLGAHDFISKPGLYDDLINILKPLLT